MQENIPELSLVKGGPLFDLWRRLGLCGDDLEFVERRVIVTAAIVWLPLLILSLIDGRAFGSNTKVPFVYDIFAHARFLVAVPILVAGEVLVHRRIGQRIKYFLTREIVVGEEIPKFRAAVESAHRMRDSWFLEFGLLLLVYTAGLLFWRNQMALETPTWYAVPNEGALNVTLAGYWLVFVSVPLLQFFLLRYYVRLGIWAVFLWRISRLDLRLVATHPDRAGGLGFIARCSYAAAALLFAQGMILSGFIATEVLYNGRNLMDFKVEAAAFVIFFTAAVLLPFTVFSFNLSKEKRRGLREYGLFASQYGIDFDRKWIAGINPAGELPLGTGDIQSLADLGNSYTVIREMNLVPFSFKDAAFLATVTIVPLLPLLFFVFSLSEVVDRVVQILF